MRFHWLALLFAGLFFTTVSRADDALWREALAAARSAALAGNYLDAAQGYGNAVQQAASFGKDNWRSASMRHDLGEVLRRLGRYEQAESELNGALRGYELAFGADSAPSVNTIKQLALLYEAQGSDADAERYARRALTLAAKAFGD